MASTGFGLPEVCQRHGRTAVRRRKITFYAPPPGWTYLLLLLGVVPFLIVASFSRTRIVAAAWPVCDRCLEIRQRLAIGLAVTGAVVLLTLLTRSLGLVLLTCLIAVLVVAGLVSARKWGAILAAVVTEDGGWLKLSRPVPGYEQMLPSTSQPVAPMPFDWSTIQPN